jgi:hypothetical protein
MEKNTVTIEIKQEVSIALLWIVVGVIVVSLVFLLTPASTDLWPATNAAGIAAGIYIIALLTYTLRKPLSMKNRFWIGLSTALVLGLGIFNWTKNQERVHWQAETLMRIRGVIGRGVMRYEMIPAMLGTLREFHHPKSGKIESLAQVFSRLHPGAMVGSNIHQPQWEGDSMKVIVAKLESGQIELLSQETYVHGREPHFRNYNGQSGMLQEKIILTEKGFTHVSEN